MKKTVVFFLSCLLLAGTAFAQIQHRISQEELRDKISGYWIGQCVGNYMGFPFEGTYLEDPVPVMVDRYYSFTARDLMSRGFIPPATGSKKTMKNGTRSIRSL